MAQPIRTPDIEAQRAAMKKLDFLIGQWAGEASVLRGPRSMGRDDSDRRSATQTGWRRAAD
jgi:hypothetical protein